MSLVTAFLLCTKAVDLQFTDQLYTVNLADIINSFFVDSGMCNI